MPKNHQLGSILPGSNSSTGYTYYNRTFEDITDLFLYACTHGDYMLVYSLLKRGDVKANVCNRMGKSALQLAIEKEHFEVVKILLDTIPYEQFRDALLLAIYLGHTKIADFILNHQTYRTFEGGFLDPKDPQAYDDSQFSSDITPLILAAQYNRLLIVHQLLLKGERIQKPHQNMCSCMECVANLASDSFRQAQTRLSAYRGLASEVYIALAYPDPILQAFELSHELRSLAKDEHYFCEEYKKLVHQLSIFVARLLDNVRGHEELEIVLNKTGRPNEEKYEILSRFDLAIQYREKPFVSHSNCQQRLMTEWYANLSAIKNAHIFKRAIFYLGYIICFPFLALTFYLFPKSKIGSLCNQPNLKFKAYIASYFIFIGLILASSSFSGAYLENTKFLSNYDTTIYKNYIQLIYQNIKLKNAIIGNEMNNTIDAFVNCDVSLRFMAPNPFQIAIFIWVMGFLWNELKQIFTIGLRVYLKTPSNYVDCSMNILYVTYFICLYSSMILTRLAMNIFQSADYWTHLARYESLSDTDKQYYISQTRHVLYWLNADRFYWNNGDLDNLAEAFFAMGNVVSICRICFLLPIIAFVGPLQVMLDRMIIDIAKWLVIIIIFFVAFACSLFLIYSYFAALIQQQNALTQASTSTMNSSNTITNQTSTNINNGNCPDYFYQLLNQAISPVIYDPGTDITSNDNLDFCQQSSSYGTLTHIGLYPAIYYFGESFQSTLKTTFFTLFGVIAENGIPNRGYEMIALSCYQPDVSTYLSGFDTFVSNLGFVVYGLFTFVCVTVLINTLIAMLEETIEDIDDRADIEWKFARSKLYMEYIRSGNSLPVPLNLCPLPTTILDLFHRLKRMIFLRESSWKEEKKKKKNPHENALHINMGRIVNNVNKPHTTTGKAEMEKNLNRRRSYAVFKEKFTYKLVIERIVKRFLLYYKNNRNGLEDKKTESQFREVKNDIGSFRFEVSYLIDQLDETSTTLVESMNHFNDDLKEHFDLEQIKHHLDSQ